MAYRTIYDNFPNTSNLHKTLVGMPLLGNRINHKTNAILLLMCRGKPLVGLHKKTSIQFSEIPTI